LNIFFDIHKDLPREGPGDNASTLRALSLLSDRPLRPTLLDIGCGPGMQTLAIAKKTHGPVVAIDTHRPYLQRLQQSAESAGRREQITLVNASMLSLPFIAGTVDVIWSEGAIYVAGFERGLREWRRLLRPRGYVVVSELTWLQAVRPVEAVRFWQVGYPGMHTIEENLETIQAVGYRSIGHFVLPESGWWEHYYTPLELRLASLRDRYQDDAAANNQLNQVARQIDLYRKCSDAYGYVFYIMQSASGDAERQTDTGADGA
jgi:SAM-dependent methyltransferase